MDSMTIIAIVSIITAGVTIALGSIAPAVGEGRAVSTALTSLAQQPDASSTITRTLFVGLAMIETDLIGVELPDGPQALLKVCTALLQAEVNIIQAYPILLRPHGRPCVALMVDNIDMGLETLAVKGFTMIRESDLAENE